MGRIFMLQPFIVLFLSAALFAGNAVVPGEFITEPATLINLGFEWNISGDDNRNATVAVSYRKKGDEVWKEALPLLRIGDEKVFRRDAIEGEYVTPHMFAGSILDLEENTEYECRFVMSDPDGVEGEGRKTVTVRTRPEPVPIAGGRVFHVYPAGYEGQKEEPAFTGLKHAYYGPGSGDWDLVNKPRVKAGDIILVHAGLYKSDRLSYADPMGLPFHGTYILTADGTPEKPIVIKGAGDGEVIFDGAGCYRLFDVMAADYNYFEGITIRNTDIAFYAGLKDVLGCSGLTVKNCRMEKVGIGVMTRYAGSKNFYIADNVLIGRDDQNRLHGWFSPGNYEASPLLSYYGIKVYGQGHVICHNYLAYFHDGICVCTHGFPEEAWDLKALAIDIYNNDVFLMTDDFIEADGGVHNIRILRNRGTNAAQCGLSAQPVYGGPAYFIRNVIYHMPVGIAFKFFVNPAGLFVYHNTVISEWTTSTYSNGHFRNNLYLGTDRENRPIFGNTTFTSYTTHDYNGYRLNRNSDAQFVWRAPAGGVMQDYDMRGNPPRSFASLSEYSAATGNEKNGILVDYDIFRNVARPDPLKPHAVYSVSGMDFRLRPGSNAVDAGAALPNINDGFNGKAPDLGAYELGDEPPDYGPRTETGWLRR